MKLKIAVILPKFDWDYLANTVLDGLFQLKDEMNLEFFVSSAAFSRLPLGDLILGRKEFVSFAQTADLIFLLWGKRETDFELAEEINLWNKTAYIDGSEPGRNRRYDPVVRQGMIDGSYQGRGLVDLRMISLCQLYFRREKPYIKGIIPLPYGIESSYLKNYRQETDKDIDFTCIFGQEEYPPMRKEVREALVDFCLKEGFKCETSRTSNEDDFYGILARTKIGISTGGGGFDTARFWEILGNNCLLLTETIDIFQPNDDSLKFKRIYEFGDMDDFGRQLRKIADFLRTGYRTEDLAPEYREVLKRHSSKARVAAVLGAARSKGLL